MKLKNIFSTLAIASVILLSSCSEDDNIDVSLSPKVSITAPAKNATNVALASNITATFSDEMDPSTINTSTFTLKQGETAVAGTVSYTGSTATFNPSAPLTQNTTYTGTITTGATNTLGSALASNYTFSFKTVAVTDNALPIINSISPINNATNVVRNTLILAVFNETMDASTINTSTFTLKQGNTIIPGTVSYSGTTATFNPTNILAAGTTYTALITKGAKDLAGNAITADKTWSFKTVIATTNLAVVNLKTSGNYVILAKQPSITILLQILREIWD